MLGGLDAQRLIATGESQSASRLVTYIDAVHPLVDVFDGFLVHSRSAGGSPLDARRRCPRSRCRRPSTIRDDLDVPVMVVQAEGDVISSNLGARQPDTPIFREWEIAGTSHADAYTIVGRASATSGRRAARRRCSGTCGSPWSTGCALPINAGPHHWVLDAAFQKLETWVRTGVAPPSGPPLQVASSSPAVLVRDAQGNALGGVRSPHVDAPVARLDGLNTGAGFCRLFGSTTPLTTAELTALYPTHCCLRRQVGGRADAAVAKGFITAADTPELWRPRRARPSLDEPRRRHDEHMHTS